MATMTATSKVSAPAAARAAGCTTADVYRLIYDKVLEHELDDDGFPLVDPSAVVAALQR